LEYLNLCRLTGGGTFNVIIKIRHWNSLMRLLQRPKKNNIERDERIHSDENIDH